MPLEKEECECCGDIRDVCPECGSEFVTPMDNPCMDDPMEVVKYGGMTVGEYTNVCWDCSWEERVSIEIDRREV